MEEMRSEIIASIRSCLISIKGRVTLRQLEADYLTIVGGRIPYQRLGHKTLEQFLQSVPSLVTTRGPRGEVLVEARVSEKTAHISLMVQKQKSNGTKSKKSYSYAPRSHRIAAQPPPTTPRWKPKKYPHVTSTNNNYSKPVRMAAAPTQKQFISGGGYSLPKVPSKIVVPDRSEFKRPPSSPPREELRRYHSSPEKGSNESTESIEADFRDDCSPLNSTMRRISRIMSGITIPDRDSGNSSPTTEYAAAMVPEFVKTGDPIQDLRNFAASHKLGEVEVKFTHTKSKKAKVSQCHCKITVNQHKYSSYPDDFFEEKAAERHASQKALDDLMTKYSKRKSLLLSSDQDVIERIPPMLEKHNNAVWMWQIEADYIDKYNEQLPANWLNIIDKNPHVHIDKCLGGWVLKHCNPDDVLQKGKKLDISLNIGEVSVPCNTVNPAPNHRLYAVITAAHSTSAIWCQQCGTPEYENFVRMNSEMEAYYNQHKSELLAPQINLGSCYVVHHDNGWLRARAMRMIEDGIVDCFLIDYGEEVNVSVDNVYAMKRQFALEMAQAFVCKLEGLEEFYEISIESQHLAAVVGKEFVLEVALDEAGRDEDDVTLLVVMYDIDTASPINEELISLLAIEASLPVLDKNLRPVYVSNIEANGDVYVQVRSVGYWHLADLLTNLTESIVKSPPANLPPPTRESSDKRLFLVRCNVTQRWLRATIIDWAPRGDLAQIYFVDVGNAQVVSVANERMYPLDGDVVSQYPPQAVKVRFMIEPIPPDFVERAAKLLPKDRPALLRIHSHDKEGVAWAEFFDRTNNVLVFINKSISVEAELENLDVGTTFNNNDDVYKKRQINLAQFGDSAKTVPSGGSLKKPDLPKVGDYFNVNIPFAVNPWNFFVQPLDSFNELTALMADMQHHYTQLQFSPIQIDDVIPGKIYASKHEDGLWYRTSVLKVIKSGGLISAFYCDFGYYTHLTLAQLVPLDLKYMDFPYQALKARIAGIAPIKSKWTMEDCDMFNSLVVKKQFVSVLVSIGEDELYKSDIVLHLLLIDTSSDQDVHIKDVLIERGVALDV